MHTQEEATKLVQEYHRSKQSERLGQFLMNRMPIRVQDSDLFYCTDDDEAASKYFARYVIASQEEVLAWNKKCNDQGFPTTDIVAAKKKICRIEFKKIQGSVFCHITLHNGRVFEGQSGCVSPQRFNFEIGKKFSYERALTALMESESYLLQTKLYEEGKLWLVD